MLGVLLKEMLPGCFCVFDQALNKGIEDFANYVLIKLKINVNLATYVTEKKKGY